VVQAEDVHNSTFFIVTSYLVGVAVRVAAKIGLINMKFAKNI